MKWLGSTKRKTNKDKNGDNVPRLEITEVVLIHSHIVNNDYQQDSKVLGDQKLLRWRRLEDVLKTCLEDVLKTCLEDVLKMSWRHVWKTS